MLTLDEQMRRASARGEIDKMKALVAKGASVNATELHGPSPLFNATSSKGGAAVKWLLENGAHINA